MKTALSVIGVQVGIIDHLPSYNKDQVLLICDAACAL